MGLWGWEWQQGPELMVERGELGACTRCCMVRSQSQRAQKPGAGGRRVGLGKGGLVSLGLALAASQLGTRARRPVARSWGLKPCGQGMEHAVEVWGSRRQWGLGRWRGGGPRSQIPKPRGLDPAAGALDFTMLRNQLRNIMKPTVPQLQVHLPQRPHMAPCSLSQPLFVSLSHEFPVGGSGSLLGLQPALPGTVWRYTHTMGNCTCA